MIKNFLSKKPITQIIPKTLKELGKYFARLELAHSKLDKRNKKIFEECCFHLKKGAKKRAAMYANEIVEIRKILSILQHTKLSIEQAMLRLETLNEVSPTFDDLKGVFGYVENALGLMVNVMPSVTPEIRQLNIAINEILDTTEFNLNSPEPIVIPNQNMDIILSEASELIKGEIEKRIPEPPEEIKVPEEIKPKKQIVALTTIGEEINLSRDNTQFGDPTLPTDILSSNKISEELVIDYLERNKGEMSISNCSKELGMTKSEIFEALDSLSKKEKIKFG